MNETSEAVCVSVLTVSVQLWEDEMCPSPGEADDDLAAAAAQATGVDDVSGVVASECEVPEVESHDVEDVNEHESTEQECLINFTDDDGELCGPAAGKDVDGKLNGPAENEDENDDGELSGPAADEDAVDHDNDLPSDSATRDLADVDATTSPDDVGIQSSVGEM